MISNLPEGWREIKLEEILNIKHGYGFKGKDFSDTLTNRVLLTPGNFKIGGGYTDSKLKYYSENIELNSDFVLSKDDLIVTMTDLSKKIDTLGYSALIPDNEYTYLHNQRIGLVNIKEEYKNNVNKYYLYWIMRTYNYQRYIANTSTGTTVHHTAPKTIMNYEIVLPGYVEQKTIADTLSALDDKIELNNKINENLEKQAQAIFKHWFIDFEFPDENGNPYKSSGGEMVNSELGMIPKGWEVNPLDDFIERIDNRGKTPPYENNKTEFPLLDVGTLRGDDRIVDYNKVSKYVSEETYNNWFRNGHPKNNDILISTVGSLAEMKLFVGDIGCIAQNVIAMRTKDTLPFYLYEYLKFIKNDLISYDIGTVQPSIKITHIIKHPLLLPRKDILSNFHEIAEKITKKIYLNNLSNQKLSQLRDTLLPKLMSGEIRIPLD